MASKRPSLEDGRKRCAASVSCDRPARRLSPYCTGCQRVFDYWKERSEGQRLRYTQDIERRSDRMGLIGSKKIVSIRGTRRA